jgi:hypothetical protein
MIDWSLGLGHWSFYQYPLEPYRRETEDTFAAKPTNVIGSIRDGGKQFCLSFPPFRCLDYNDSSIRKDQLCEQMGRQS